MKFRFPTSLGAKAFCASFGIRSPGTQTSLRNRHTPIPNITWFKMSQSDSGHGFDDTRLVWVDCEMTGLNLGKDKIIEISALITNQDLEIVEPQGFERIIHCPETMMNNMDQWCTEQHGKSGLTTRVLASMNSTAEVEDDLLQYIKRYVKQGEGHLAGSCVYVDREFMRYEFPRVIDYLHWRLIGLDAFLKVADEDVSTVRFLSAQWMPIMHEAAPPRKKEHRAMADIKESIAELKYYKESLWKATEQ